jgi:hypothetical protein
MKIYFSTLTFLFFFSAAFAQQKIEVNNDIPRYDTDGKIVDAHDGRVIQFGDTFYWYGTQYGDTNGFVETNKYVSYSSKDLKTWKFEGELLGQHPKGVYYRPHVIYNQQTQKYVLWYNWYPKLWNGQFGVAISDSPTGPFKIINENATVKHSGLGVGDLGLFVDDNQKAYLSYNTITGHSVSVEELNDDYTQSTLKGSEFIAKGSEAGSMFKRKDTYYLLTDYTCCFCTQGSGAKVFIAKNPLGPYQFTSNINRYPGSLVPVLNDGFSKDNQYVTLTSKINSLEFWLSETQAISSLNVYQFTGDRNGQCGDVTNPKVHDLITDYNFEIFYDEDGEWKKVKNANPLTTKTALETNYQFQFDKIETSRLMVVSKIASEKESVNISEVVINNKPQNFKPFILNQQQKPIIPAQQSYVMQVKSKQGYQYLWMGDLWGSATDNVKGHDYQYWSAPLQFYNNGNIKPLQWNNQWKLKIKK